MDTPWTGFKKHGHAPGPTSDVWLSAAQVTNDDELDAVPIDATNDVQEFAEHLLDSHPEAAEALTLALVTAAARHSNLC